MPLFNTPGIAVDLLLLGNQPPVQGEETILLDFQRPHPFSLVLAEGDEVNCPPFSAVSSAVPTSEHIVLRLRDSDVATQTISPVRFHLHCRYRHVVFLPDDDIFNKQRACRDLIR